MRRIVAVSDLHCGHWSGLTPPAWHYSGDEFPHAEKHRKIQRELYREFERLVDEVRPVYDVLCVGDLIDGVGQKSGGVEQVTTDLFVQGEMATECLRMFEPENGFLMVYGTGYHVSPAGQDREKQIAKALDCEIHDQAWAKYLGTEGATTFDFKHKVGSSSVPYSRATSVAKEHTWNQMWWADEKRQPLADVILRGHVHYFRYTGGTDWLAMTLPCLQADTSYGGRVCSGRIDWGFVTFDVGDDGRLKTWQPRIVKLKTARAKALER